MVNNLFYISWIHQIGGVETWIYSIARKYADLDILVVYGRGDPDQVRRLQKYVRVKKFDGSTIKCKRAFFCMYADIIDHVEAEEYIQVIHGDYSALGLADLIPRYPQVTRYIGVSKQACKTYEELTGRKVELCYNPLIPQEARPVLHLISACRLSMEKGLGRMIRLAKALDDAGVPFSWTVYTVEVGQSIPDCFDVRKPRLDLADYIADADYLVQLSDTEGYSYSILEALSLGTPVIVTDFPSIAEMKVKNGKNGWILPMDMSEIPVAEICTGLPPFDYTPRPDRWDRYLVPGPGTYQEELASAKAIRCTALYYDLDLQRDVRPGEILTVTPDRAMTVIESGFAELYTEEE